jgi:hypothetical protein
MWNIRESQLRFTLSAVAVFFFSMASARATTSTYTFLLSGPTSIQNSSCATFTISRVYTSTKNSAPASEARPINLSGQSQGHFYAASDTGCANSPVSTLTLGKGSASVQFNYMDAAIEAPTLTASDGTKNDVNTLPGSAGVNVTAGAPTKLVFLTEPSGALAGAAISPSVRVAIEDKNGNVVTNSSLLVTVAMNGSIGKLLGSTQAAAVNGIASFASLSVDQAGNGFTLSAASSGLTSATSSGFNITPAQASQLVFISQPANGVAGVALTPALELEVQDAYGNLVTSSSATIMMTLTGSSSALQGTTSVSSVNGVAAFSNLSVDLVGTSYQLSASSSGLTSATSQAFNIAAGASAQLAFTVQPTNTSAGVPISPAVQVAVEDAFGNLITNSTSKITLSPSVGSLQLTGTTTVAAVNGVATFSNISSSSKAFNLELIATSSGLTQATSSAFSFYAASGSKLAYLVQPSNGVAGASITPGVQVAMEDQYGNLVSRFNGSISVSLNGSVGSLLGTTTASAVNGIATFSNLSNDTASNGYSLSASSSGVNPQNSSSFNVSAAQPSALAYTSAAQQVAAGSCSAQVGVKANDSFGNSAVFPSGTTLTLSSSVVGAVLSFFSDSACTKPITSLSIAANSGSGLFYFSSKSGGSATLTVSGTGVTSVAQQETVSGGVPVQLAFLVQPSSVPAGSAITPAPQVAVEDINGNIISSSTASVTMSLKGSTAALQGTLTVNVVSGIATFPNLSLNQAASGYVLSASSTSLTSATSTAFNVSAGAASKLAYVVQPSNTIAGVSIAPAIQVAIEDSYGNIETALSSSVSVALNGNGTLLGTKTVNTANGVAQFSNLSIDQVGSGLTLTATSAGLSSAASASFNVSGGVPLALTITTPPMIIPAGSCSTSPVTAQAQDGFGNPAVFSSGASLSLSSSLVGASLGFYSDSACSKPISALSIAANQGSGSFYISSNVSGTATLTVSGTGLTSAQQQETVNPGAPAKLAYLVQPSSASAGVVLSPPVQIAIEDANGNTVLSSSAIVTLISSQVTLNGTLSVAASKGVAAFANLSVNQMGNGYQITASSTGLTSATSTAFSVSAGAPKQLAFTVQPSSVTAGSPIAPSIQVSVQDAYGNLVNTSSTSISLSSPQAALGGTDSATASAGIASFSNVSVNTAGNGYTLIAQATGLSNATSAAFNVMDGAATQLAFLVQPSSVNAGSPITPGVQVVVEDSDGNIITNSQASVSLAIGTNPSGATLGGSLSVKATNGVATFGNLNLSMWGNGFTVVASSPGLASATSSAFNASEALCDQPLATIADPSKPHGIYVINFPSNAPSPGPSTAPSPVPSDLLNNPVVCGGNVYIVWSQVDSGPGVTPRYNWAQIESQINQWSSAGKKVNLVAWNSSDTPTNTALPSWLTSGINAVPTVSCPAVNTIPVFFDNGFVSQYQTFMAAVMSQYGSDPRIGYVRFGLGKGGETVPTCYDQLLAIAESSCPKSGECSGPVTDATSFTQNVWEPYISKMMNYENSLAHSVQLMIGIDGIDGPGVTTALDMSFAGWEATTATQLGWGFGGQGLQLSDAVNWNSYPQPAVTPDQPAPIPSSMAQTCNENWCENFLAYSGYSPLELQLLGHSVPNGTQTGSLVQLLPFALQFNAQIFELFIQDLQVAYDPTNSSYNQYGLAYQQVLQQVANKIGGMPGTPAPAAPSPTVGSASQLSFIVQPGNTPLRTPIPLIQVAVEDLKGNEILNSSAPVTLTFHGAGSVTGLTTTTAINGIASFYSLNFSQAANADNFTAASGSLTSATSASFNVTSDPATTLSITSSQQSVQAGACSAVVDIVTVDQAGNPTRLTSPAILTLSGAVSFFSDSVCTAPLSELTIGAGADTGAFYFSSTTAGVPMITVSTPGMTSGVQTENILSSAASQIAYLSQPTNGIAGTPLTSFQVGIEDKYGNLTNSTSTINMSINNSSLSGSTSVAASGGIATFNNLIVDQVGSGYALTANSGTLTGTTSTPFNIAANTPAALAITSSPMTLQAGACSSSPVAVQAQDSYGNPAVFSAAASLPLSSSMVGASLSFYSDSACSLPITALSIPANAGNGSFYVSSKTSGTATLTVSGTGVASASQQETVNPGAPTKLAYLTQPSNAIAGVPIAPAILIAIEDVNGNIVNSSASVGLISGQTTLQGTTSVQASAGTAKFSNVSIDQTGSGDQLTASSTGLLSATSNSFAVTAAAPASLALSPGPQTLKAGICSAAIQLKALDSFGNAATFSAQTSLPITSSVGGATLSFYLDSSCTQNTTSLTIASGSGTGSFYFSSKSSGLGTLTLGNAPLSVQQTEVINAGVPSTLTLVASKTVGAGTCSIVQAELFDQLGNPSSFSTSTALALTSSGTSVLGFYLDSACSNSVTSYTLAGGATSGSFYFSGAKAGSATMTASGGGLTGQAAETITAGSASKLAFVSQPGNLGINGTFNPPLSVEVLDGSGNLISSSSATVQIQFANNPGASSLSGTLSAKAVNGVATFSGLGVGAASSPNTLVATSSGLAWGVSRAFSVAASGQPQVSPKFFGIHVNKNSSPWPNTEGLSFGTFRALASTGPGGNTSWPTANPSPGVYNWTVVDDYIAKAQSAGQVIIQDIYATPSWASALGNSYPTPCPSGGPYVACADTSCGSSQSMATAGFCDRPSDLNLDGTGTNQIFKTFVTALVNHSCGIDVGNNTCGPGQPGGKIKYYEVWNEPDINSEWNNFQSGAKGNLVAPLVRMAQDAQAIIKSIDPSAMLTTPPVTSPGLQTFVGKWLSTYISAGGGQYADIFGIHGYTETIAGGPAGTWICQPPTCYPNPEQVLTVVTASQNYASPATSGLQGLPFFITEGGGVAFENPDASSNYDLDSAYLGRYYLLVLGTGAVSNFNYWGWDMSSGDFWDSVNKALRPTATTYNTIYGWTVGNTVEPCTVASNGTTYTCNIVLPNGSTEQAIWDTSQSCVSGNCTTINVSVNTSFTEYVDLTGTVFPISVPGTVAVGAKPILMKSTDVPVALSITSVPQSVQAGICSAIVDVATVDKSGNPTPLLSPATLTLSGSVSFFSDSACMQPLSALTIPAGADTGEFYFLSTTAGVPAITVTTPGMAAVVQTETIQSASASQLVYLTEPSGGIAGLPMASFQVGIEDQYGNLTESNSTVTLTINTSSLSGSASIPAVGGIATFSNLTIDQIGSSYTLTAKSGTLTNATSILFGVAAGAPAVIAITSPSLTLTSGGCSTSAVSVQAQDSFGNPALFTTGASLSLSSSAVGAILSFYSDPACSQAISFLSVSANQGTGSFYVSSKAAGSATLTISDSGLQSAFQQESVIPGAASVLAYLTQPSNTVAGAPFAPAIQVAVEDVNGNIVTNSTATISLASSGSNALQGTTSVTASAGVAVFSAVSMTVALPKNQIVVSGVGSPVTSNSFAVSSGAASKLAFTVQPTNSVAGVALSPAVQVSVEDTYGNLVNTSSAVVSLSSQQTALSGTTSVSSSQGIAIFSNIIINTSGTGYTLSAAASGLGGATSTPFNVLSTSATQLAFTVQPSSVNAGSAMSPRIQVNALDNEGNTVSTFSGPVTLSIGSNPAQAILGGNVQVNAVAGIATFGNVSLSMWGNGFTLIASSPAMGSATSASFNVNETLCTQPLTTVPVPEAPHGIFALKTPPAVASPGPQASYVPVPNYVVSNPTVCGGTLSVIWSQVDNGPGAAPGSRFDWSKVETAISQWTQASKSVNLLIWAGGSYTSPNYATPAWVFNPPGPSPTPVPTIPNCTNDGNLPVFFNPVYVSLYQQFMSTVMARYGSDPRVGYIRFGMSQGNENNAFCLPGMITAAQQEGYSQVVDQNTFATYVWEPYLDSMMKYEVSLPHTATLDIAVNPFGSPFQPSVPDWQAQVATGLGFAIGNEGLSQTDETAWNNNPQPNPNPNDTCIGDWCNLFNIYRGRNAEHIQLLGPSNPAGTGEGSLVTLFPFASQFGAQIYEMYPSDFSIAYNVNDPNYKQYGLGYQRVLQQIANQVGGAPGVAPSPAPSPSPSPSASASPSPSPSPSPSDPAVSIGFTSAPQTIGAGSCSSAIRLQALDAGGNPTSFTMTTGMNLSSTYGGPIGFYSDSACTKSITSILVPAGSGTGTFFFTTSTLGAVGITVETDDLSNSAQQSETVTIGAPSKLAFITQPSASLSGGILSPAVQLAVEDQFGNLITGSSATMSVSLVPTTGGLSGTTSVNSSGGIASFSTLSIANAGTYTLSAASTGLSSATSSSFNVLSPLTISTTSLSQAVQGQSYSQPIQVSGGVAPYLFSVVSGQLPAGMSLSGGVITGAPSVSGTFNFTVQVTDSGQVQQNAQQAFSLQVFPLLAITATALPAGIDGEAYSDTLSATGGSGSYTWSITSGALPAGIVFNTNGTISGTPDDASVESLTFQVTSGTQSASTALTLTITEPQGNVYVATNGNDKWDGTQAEYVSGTTGPVATIGHAQALVQALRKANPNNPVTVMIRGGTYPLALASPAPSSSPSGAPAPLNFTTADSGTATAPVIWQNYAGETPVISGGVPITNWSNAGGGVWTANLQGLGLQTFTQLWVNGQRRYRPRVVPGPAPSGNPGGYLYVANSIASPNPLASGCPVCTGCSVIANQTACLDRFQYYATDPVPSAPHNLSQVEVPFFGNWTMSRMRISSVDTTNHVIYFNHSVPNEDFDVPRANHRYLIENTYENLAQGEWYLDTDTSGNPTKLYYMPNSNENMATATVTAPQMSQLLIANGTGYVTFQGITFADTNMTVPSTGYISAEAETTLPAVLSFTNSSNITFNGCTMARLGQYGMSFQTANNGTPQVSQNNMIENSLLYDIGAGGIILGRPPTGKDQYVAGQIDNVVSNTTIQNTMITGIDRFLPAGNGVWQGNSHNNTYQHLDIHDTYTVALSMGFTFDTTLNYNIDNLVQYNHFYNLFQGILVDGGAIHNHGITKNTTANPNSSGSTLQYNKIHDVQHFAGKGGYGSNGIYLDGYTGNVTAQYNLIYRTAGSSMCLTVGQNNTIFNNIFAYGQYDPNGEYDNTGEPNPGVIGRSQNGGIYSLSLTNNIIYYSGTQDLLDVSLAANEGWLQKFDKVYVCTNGLGAGSTAQVACSTEFNVNENMYFNADGATGNTSGPTTWGGYQLSGWQALGEDTTSTIANPQFDCPGNQNGCTDNYTLSSASTAQTAIGFTPIDSYISQAGPQSSLTLTVPYEIPAAFPTAAPW